WRSRWRDRGVFLEKSSRETKDIVRALFSAHKGRAEGRDTPCRTTESTEVALAVSWRSKLLASRPIRARAESHPAFLPSHVKSSHAAPFDGEKTDNGNNQYENG